MTYFKKFNKFLTGGILAFALILMPACSDDSSTEPDVNETAATDDGADIVASSMAESTGGATTQLGVAGDIAATVPVLLKNIEGMIPFSDTTTIELADSQTVNGNQYSFRYQFTHWYNFELSTMLLHFYYNANGNFNGPRASATDTVQGHLQIGNLTGNDSTITINGEYSRAGQTQQKVRAQHHFQSQLDITWTDIVMHKLTREIKSGTANLSLQFTVDQSTSYTFTGTLTFNGDGTALLTLNQKTYTINLQTGEIS